MSVIAEFSVSASDFALGRALQAAPEITVDVDKMIPVGSDAIPYFWVIGEERDAFDAVLEDEPALDEFTVVDELDGRALCRVVWDPSSETIVHVLADHDLVLQDASGDADTWTFQLRFPDSHTLSEFHTTCRNADVDITVERLYNPIEPTERSYETLTDAQRSLIEHAYDEGYFEVPRKTTLVELAEELGVSDQAVNERLRRGLHGMVGATLKSDRG